MDTIYTPLHTYIETDEAFFLGYEAYEVDRDRLKRIQAEQPTAHVVIPSRKTCPDCARNVPKMTRIAEHLPGWTWEIFDSTTNPERMVELGIRAVPTFIVYDQKGGEELGRIIENPLHGSLEADLLHLLTGRAE